MTRTAFRSTGRVRRRPDFGRLREASAGPGADTRTWVTLGRVRDADDAIAWIDGSGWVVDVDLSFGDLAGDTDPIACRVAQAFGGNERGSSVPIERSMEVVVLMPGGDTVASPVIVGILANRDDQRVPSEVNGETIDLDFAEATHFLVTPKDVEWQVGSAIRFAATDLARFLAQEVRLADADADQAFVRGNDQLDALNSFLDALDAFANTLATATPAPPNGALTVAVVLAAYELPGVGLRAKIAAAKQALEASLSSRIKGV